MGMEHKSLIRTVANSQPAKRTTIAAAAAADAAEEGGCMNSIWRSTVTRRNWITNNPANNINENLLPEEIYSCV
jgi:hypothetical protein